MTMPLTLKLSKDFKIPDIYLTDSIESIQEALWIGATIQQSVHAYRADSAVQVIQDTAKKEVDALKQRIAMLQSERCLLEESHQTAIRITRSNASDTVRKELSEKMASIENQLALVEERRRFVEDAKQEDSDGKRPNHRSAGHGFEAYFVSWLGDENVLENNQVVVERNGVQSDGEDDKPKHSGICPRT